MTVHNVAGAAGPSRSAVLVALLLVSYSYGAGGADLYVIKTDANGSSGVGETADGRPGASGRPNATPNPSVSSSRIHGHEAARLAVFDIPGTKVGMFRGDRVGEGLSPAVCFVQLNDGHGVRLRLVKVR